MPSAVPRALRRSLLYFICLSCSTPCQTVLEDFGLLRGTSPRSHRLNSARPLSASWFLQAADLCENGKIFENSKSERQIMYFVHVGIQL
ncbi:hypothetical protein GGI43DRAFT_213766 [Trichoderma evansii]